MRICISHWDASDLYAICRQGTSSIFRRGIFVCQLWFCTLLNSCMSSANLLIVCVYVHTIAYVCFCVCVWLCVCVRAYTRTSHVFIYSYIYSTVYNNIAALLNDAHKVRETCFQDLEKYYINICISTKVILHVYTYTRTYT